MTFLTSTDSGSSETIEKLKDFFKSPVFYIVLGAIVLLIVLIYFLKRFIKAKPNTTIIIVRNGIVHKIVDKDCPRYFMVPFRDSIGAIVSDSEKSFSSDKLFINDGPDALYKISYTLTYRIISPRDFYPYMRNVETTLPVKINDGLRLFADKGNALVLIKDYRTNNDVVLKEINNILNDYSIEVSTFKINFIEPIGNK